MIRQSMSDSSSSSSFSLLELSDRAWVHRKRVVFDRVYLGGGEDVVRVRFVDEE